MGLDSTACALEFIKKGIPTTLSHTATGNIVLGKAMEIVKSPILNNTTLVVTDMRTGEADSPGFGSLSTRGLLFISNALVVASCLGCPDVCLPENGPLIINPSVSFGSEPTKNSHPFLIKTLENIYNHVSRQKKEIKTIFKDKTKAEISACITRDQIIEKTWSCFNIQRQSRMCGVCFACAVRRLSLLAAGYYEPLETYECDPFAAQLSDAGTALGWKLDDLHDTFVYLFDFLKTESFKRNEMFLIPEGFFENEKELMRRFSLDMFLGFKKHMEQIGSGNMGALGKFVNRLLDCLPQSEINEREEMLRKISENTMNLPK